MRIIKENWLGIIGLITLCAAIPMPDSVIKYSLNILGFLALVAYAQVGSNPLFFYFEIVALIGYLLYIFHAVNIFKYPLMLILTIAALIKILSFNDYRKWYTSLAIIGLLGLVYGYLTNSNWGFVVGGVAMTFYGFIGFYQGIKIALIFGILNLIYGGIAIYMLIQPAN